MVRPKLIVRFGKGGGISSPTSSRGYALVGFIGLVLTAGVIGAISADKPMFLFVLPVALFPLRDAWAWFSASEDERDAFRAQVHVAVTRGHAPGPDQIAYGNRWGRVQVGLLAAASVGAAAWIGWGHVELFPVAGMLWALFLVSLFDQVRRWMRRSR